MPIPIAGDAVLSRQFIPETDPKYGYFSALTSEERAEYYSMVSYDNDLEFKQLRSIFLTGPCSWEIQVERCTLVVEIGIKHCRMGEESIFAVGVEFGPVSRYNEMLWLLHQHPQCQAFAIVSATVYALTSIEMMKHKCPRICDVKIRTNCEWIIAALAWNYDVPAIFEHYVVGQIAQENAALLKDQIDHIASRLSDLEDYGLQIEFWYVENCEEAEYLAEQLLIAELQRQNGAQDDFDDENRDEPDLQIEDGREGEPQNVAQYGYMHEPPYPYRDRYKGASSSDSCCCIVI